MAYDENLALRIRKRLIEQAGYAEKKMFGGIAYLLHGNMACGILREQLIVRVGPRRYGEALARPDTRPFDVTGRPMTGWVQVAPAGWEAPGQLSAWLELGVAYAHSLPPKS